MSPRARCRRFAGTVASADGGRIARRCTDRTDIFRVAAAMDRCAHRSRRYSTLCVEDTRAVAGLVIIGIAWTAFRADVALSERLPRWLENEDLIVVGAVHDLPRTLDDGTHFEFVVDATSQEGKHHSVSRTHPARLVRRRSHRSCLRTLAIARSSQTSARHDQSWRIRRGTLCARTRHRRHRFGARVGRQHAIEYRRVLRRRIARTHRRHHRRGIG